MSFKSKQHTPAEIACMLSVYEILAPNKTLFWWGVIKQNFVDGEVNYIEGIYQPIRDHADNGYTAYELVNLFFIQQIVTYTHMKFLQVSHVNIPRDANDPILGKLPVGWTVKNESDCMRYCGKADQLGYIVERLKFLFSDDAEMGDKVRSLVVPVDTV